MSYIYRSTPEILRFQPIQYTPIHFSFTVPLKLQGMRSIGKPTQLRISKAKNIPLGLPTSPIKVWGKSVKGFLNYIRKNILNTKIIFKKYVEFEDISVATTAFYKTVRAIFLKQMQIIFWFLLHIMVQKCIIKLGYILIQRYFMKKLILYQLCFFCVNSFVFKGYLQNFNISLYITQPSILSGLWILNIKFIIFCNSSLPRHALHTKSGLRQ